MLCFALAGALVAGVAAVAPAAWWAWLIVALPVYKLASFGGYVFARFPRKMRATALADRRIATGRFHPRSIRAYCDDPCFRVVAAEILTRAGTDRAERRRLIREFREQRAAPQIFFVADPVVRGIDNPRR